MDWKTNKTPTRVRSGKCKERHDVWEGTMHHKTNINKLAGKDNSYLGTVLLSMHRILYIISRCEVHIKWDIGFGSVKHVTKAHLLL